MPPLLTLFPRISRDPLSAMRRCRRLTNISMSPAPSMLLVMLTLVAIPTAQAHKGKRNQSIALRGRISVSCAAYGSRQVRVMLYA